MIPRLKPTLGLSELWAAFGWGSDQQVEQYEVAFAKAMSAQYALAFPYGRSALKTLLEALDLKNREIITPAYTCAVVQHAVKYSGNEPIFCDCQSTDFNMNLQHVRQLVTPKTGAILATSIFGHPVDIDDLAKISSETGVPIIQDCCHSLNARWMHSEVQNAGIAAIYGLNISKMINSIFGGMVTTNDEALYKKLKRLRDQNYKAPTLAKSALRFIYLVATSVAFLGPMYSLVNWLERKKLIDRFTLPMGDAVITMPADYLVAMAPIEARVGLANLKRLEQIVRARKEAALYYFEHLKRPEFKLPPKDDGATYSHFTVQVKNRAYWLAQARQRGLQLGEVIEYSVPEMPSYGAHSPTAFPVSAHYARHCINLPIWGGLTLAKKVVAILANIPSEVTA